MHPSRGVRQGDPLSPILFNLVFDRILNAISVEKGFRLQNSKLSHLVYADDLVVLSTSTKGLQEMIDGLEPHLK